MCTKIAALSESGRTIFTAEWFILCVRRHVNLKRSFLIEGLLTLGTFVWTLTWKTWQIFIFAWALTCKNGRYLYLYGRSPRNMADIYICMDAHLEKRPQLLPYQKNDGQTRP